MNREFFRQTKNRAEAPHLLTQKITLKDSDLYKINLIKRHLLLTAVLFSAGESNLKTRRNL